MTTQRIPIDRIRRLRYALGIALLLAGGGVLAVAPHRTFADEPAGWLLLAAAVLLLTWRNYVEVRPARRLARRTGFGYAFSWKRFDLPGVEHIEIKSVTRTDDDDDEKVSYVIGVKGIASGQLCELEEMGAARLVAERVARAAQVPLHNRLFGGWSVRKPDDLDMPLAERWRRAGRLKEAPVIDGVTTLEVRHDRDASVLSWPVRKIPRTIVAFVGTSLIAVFLFLRVTFELPLHITVIFVAALAWFTLMAVLRGTGRDQLRFESMTVEFRRGLMPHRQRMSIGAIEEILAHGEDLVLMNDREHILVDRPPGEHDRKLLRQFIERQIAQRQTAAPDQK